MTSSKIDFLEHVLCICIFECTNKWEPNDMLGLSKNWQAAENGVRQAESAANEGAIVWYVTNI